MPAAILSGFAIVLLAPWRHRLLPRWSGWLFSAFPLAQFGYFASRAGEVADGTPVTVSYPWISSLGVSLSFRLDGLGLLFSFLITGIGTLVVVYPGGYLAGHRYLGRFYAYILMFEASMLGRSWPTT